MSQYYINTLCYNILISNIMLYPIMQQSKHPLTRWKFEMINISLNRHLQSTCKGFKDSFYLMVLILSFRFDIQIHLCSVAQ